MKFYINLEHNNNLFTLFLLGYTSDGGFFVKDLINDGGKFAVVKMMIPPSNMRKFGKNRIYKDKSTCWLCSGSPKLTHHVDGMTHISGSGIMSGFYKFFASHKGVCSHSMNLRKRDNDGGPIFIFYTRNLPKIIHRDKNAINVMEKDQIIDPYDKPKNKDDNAFALEFFYLPKNVIPNLNLSSGIFSFKHPNYGIVPLKYIPAPTHAPGIIGIFTRIIAKGDSDRRFNFSLNGGAGNVLINNEYEHLSIVYPYNKEMADRYKVKNLDFDGFNKVKTKADSMLSKFLKRK